MSRFLEEKCLVQEPYFVHHPFRVRVSIMNFEVCTMGIMNFEVCPMSIKAIYRTNIAGSVVREQRAFFLFSQVDSISSKKRQRWKVGH